MKTATSTGRPTGSRTRLRQRVPTAWRPAVVGAYVQMAKITADRRVLPGFLVVGAQRCGTTSLFRALEQHPQVVRPTFHKGINYFDLDYERGAAWYRGHFPRRSTVARRAQGDATFAFEASGYYMFHPLAMERIAADLPDVRIVAMLRDPVERAYSAWKHESARGFEDQPFQTALDLEDDRLAGEAQRMRHDPGYQSHAYRHRAYRSRGDYAVQLGHIRSLLPAERLHVVVSEEFFGAPTQAFGGLCDFLGIRDRAGIAFEQHNARPSASMPEEARRQLTAHYLKDQPVLEELIGRPLPWLGAIPNSSALPTVEGGNE